MTDERIYRYVVAYDGGTAPRPYGGVCSLAICKPKIRAAARPGDWVLGFRSRHPGEVLYAMQVSEVLTFGEYWQDSRFADRRPGATAKPDNIYRPDGAAGLVQVPNTVHGPESVRRDVGGRNVLIATRFWYFGCESVPLPNHLMHLVHTTQGHAVHKNRQAGDVPALGEWLAAWPPGKHGGPVDGKDLEKGDAPPHRQMHVAGRISEAYTGRSSCRPRPASRRTPASVLPDSTRPGRLIFSRKGFDSGYGGMASPILPDGGLLPLPIPAKHDDVALGALGADDPETFAALIADLSRGRHSPVTRVHLDPDLEPAHGARLPGWRPALGQSGAAQSHLARQGVGAGDVFLFFGWFREVERHAGRWRYAKGAPDLHVLFGWLEVEEVLSIVSEREHSLARHPWIADHVHLGNPAHYTSPLNTLYVAPERSRLVPGVPGGGLFPRFSSSLRLTGDGVSRSVWDVPHWLNPENGASPLSYHADASRWQRVDNGWKLRTVAKGQEFVCDLAGRDPAILWLRDLIAAHASTPSISRTSRQ